MKEKYKLIQMAKKGLYQGINVWVNKQWYIIG